MKFMRCVVRCIYSGVISKNVRVDVNVKREVYIDEEHDGALGDTAYDSSRASMFVYRATDWLLFRRYDRNQTSEACDTLYAESFCKIISWYYNIKRLFQTAPVILPLSIAISQSSISLESAVDMRNSVWCRCKRNAGPKESRSHTE